MLKKKARNARKRPFHSKGVYKAPTHRRSHKACTKYHDYYTTITIPEHVGTRSVCISMNDILCPEVNFNPSFVVPGCRFLERPELGQYDTHLDMLQNSDDPVSKATKDYKFLMRKPDEVVDESLSFNGMEIHTKQMERRYKSGPNIMRGNILRLTRGTYNYASDIRGGVVDKQYKENDFTLVGFPGTSGVMETKHIGAESSDTEQIPQCNCAVIGTICKGNYFIPRNGALEYHLNQTRSFNADPAIRKTMVLPSGEMSYRVGFDSTGIHGAYLTVNAPGSGTTGNPFEDIARNKAYYSCGGAIAFGLGFRPDCLPGYVPSFVEVKDRTLACGLTLYSDNLVQVQPGGETDAPLINHVDLTNEMDGLWRNLSGRDQSEIMRCIALTKTEEKELYEGRPEIRSQLAGGSVWDLRPPHVWCHDNVGTFIHPDKVNAYREGFQHSSHVTGIGQYQRVENTTRVTPLKKIIQQARGIGEMVKLFDHSMVVGSKMDIELIGTGVKDRAIINENGVNVVRQGMPGVQHEIDITRNYNNDASYTPRIKCEWGVQKCYPKNENDFGIPTFKSEDTHERLPSMGQRVDPKFDYSHFYDNMTIDECEHALRNDYKNKTRKDMFKMRGHVVDAQTLRGKTKLSSKYDMNSSIKRYRMYYPDGTKKGDGNKVYDNQPRLMKDHRYVVNHRALEEDQEILHTAESRVNIKSDYDPIAQQSKNYDMREKYMPVFRVFSRRASTKDLKIVERQTKSDNVRGQMFQSPVNYAHSGGVYAMRGGINSGTVVPAAAGDGNLDAVRLGEMAPLTNHANFAAYITDHATRHVVEDDVSKVDATDVKIDGPSWNGVIDSERRRHLSHLKTPAMTFRVRVRYKVRWWNNKETNPVVPFEDSKKKDVQESSFKHTSMNNDFIGMTDANNVGRSKLEDMEDEDIHNAETRKRKREFVPTDTPEKNNRGMTDIEKKQFGIKLRRTVPDGARTSNYVSGGASHTWTPAEVEDLSTKGPYGDFFYKVLESLDAEKIAGITNGHLDVVKNTLLAAVGPGWITNSVNILSDERVQESFFKVVEFVSSIYEGGSS